MSRPRVYSCLAVSGVLLFLALPAAAAEKYEKLKAQYPGIKTVEHSKFRSACTKDDRKRASGGLSYYSVLEAPASGGGLPLRGIGYSPKGSSPGWDPVEWLLPMAPREIVQGSGGCHYLVREDGASVFTTYTINEKRLLVQGDTTDWETAQRVPSPDFQLEYLIAAGGPADATGAREAAILNSATGEVLIRVPGVHSAAGKLSVERPQIFEGSSTRMDRNALHVYLAGVRQPLLLVEAPSEQAPNVYRDRRLYVAGAAGSPFWLNSRLLVRARDTAEGPRYRLQSLDSGFGNRKPPAEFLQQEFSRIVYLGNADREMELGLDLAAIRALRERPFGLFAFEVVGADGARFWQFLYDNNGIGTGISQTLSGKYAAMAVVDWSAGAGKEWRVIARAIEGDLVMMDAYARPVDGTRAATVEAMRADMEAQARTNAEVARQRAKERAEEEERIRRAEAYYAGERANEAAVLERQRQAAAARERDSIGAALNSISNSVVKSISASTPSGPPRGVNQGVYDSRNDGTGAGYNSYRKALEREAERRVRCKGAGC